MIDVRKYIRENKQEIIKLLNERFNGRYDFVKGIIDSDDNLSGDPESFDTPWLVVDFDNGICEMQVLSVKVVDIYGDPDICFYLYDIEANEALGWYDDADALYNSENSVYEYLAELCDIDLK
jgi:hypothetical protein